MSISFVWYLVLVPCVTNSLVTCSSRKVGLLRSAPRKLIYVHVVMKVSLMCNTWRELKRLEDNVDPGGGAVDEDQVLDGLGSNEFCQHLRRLYLKLDPVSSEPAVGIALYTGQQFKPEDK